MPLQATSGAASYDAFGGGVPVVPAYIEEVFSTYLWTTSTSNQTIANGIDMTKGAMTWIKARSNVYDHILQRAAGYGGAGTPQFSNSTTAGFDGYYRLSDTASGFTMGTDYWTGAPQTAVVWTFRKQPKFFDIVTYTGNGTNNRTIAHALTSTPGCIIVKRTDSTGDWYVYHRGVDPTLAYGYFMVLNTTAARAGAPAVWDRAPTSTTFTIQDLTTNINGATYVAYLFAHNAGGFGLTGTDNVISCGEFTTNSGGEATVTLGYEPQWVLIKAKNDATDWTLLDTMRGWIVGGTDNVLYPNSASTEGTGNNFGNPTATGFQASGLFFASSAYIYIAIRRGPMKVPTSGTSVFGLNARTGTGADATVTGGQTDDAVIIKNRGSAVDSLFSTRLTGKGYLVTSSTAAEVAAGTTILQANPWDVMDGVKVGSTSTITNASANTYINYLFKRAPNFFDEVCYTGTGVARTVAHNLGVVPEMMIVKCRSNGGSSVFYWAVYVADLGNTANLDLSSDVAVDYFNEIWNMTTPTSSVFTVGPFNRGGALDKTYVALLFATCPGVSKVGTYTGNGTTQTINCGFGAGGARFVLIKRSDAVGDWYLYDTARGMTVLTDPYWLTNSAAAEAATLGSVTTVSTGFALNSAILAAINVNGGTYIFLAIA